MQFTDWPAINCRHQIATSAWPDLDLAPPKEPIADSGDGPASLEWAKTVRSLDERVRGAIDATARAVICDPDLSLKFACGLLLPTLAYAHVTFAERAEVFGEPSPEIAVELAQLLDPPALFVEPLPTISQLRSDLLVELGTLADAGRSAAGCMPAAWDETTRGEALKLVAAVDAVCLRISAAAPVPDSAETTRTAASLPARPDQLVKAPMGIDKSQVADPSPLHKTARGLHNFAFEIELGALELCAENILLGPSMPREFLVEMAVQCFDEARHSIACLERFASYGMSLDAYPVSIKQWTISRGLSLPQRLAVHQRIGEWIGVDSLIASASRFLAGGDSKTAHLMQFMARDEVRHVSYGNKWLSWFERNGYLTVDEIDSWANKYRGTFGEDAASFRALPLNEPECVDAGFSDREIERLKQARLGGQRH